MEPVSQCAQCDALQTWDCASGPDQILLRIQAMLSFVGRGFTEVRAPDRVDRDDEWLWSQLPPDMVTEPVVRAGNDWDHYVPAAIALRCDACGTVFCQSWTFDRGAERWRVIPATG